MSSFFATISCVLEPKRIQYEGMTQDAFRTKWKFVVEFEDDETKEISGTLGQAETREECEGLLEYDVQYHNLHGRSVINAEAAEVCAQCEGEGTRVAKNEGMEICDACGGRVGPISNLTNLRANGTQFLLVRRGNLSTPLSPRRAA
jgi:DnaJ-class molecular chaperone